MKIAASNCMCTKAWLDPWGLRFGAFLTPFVVPLDRIKLMRLRRVLHNALVPFRTLPLCIAAHNGHGFDWSVGAWGKTRASKASVWVRIWYEEGVGLGLRI